VKAVRRDASLGGEARGEDMDKRPRTEKLKQEEITLTEK